MILQWLIQQIQAEIGAVCDKLDRLTRNGNIICEKSRDANEQDLVRSTISTLTEQLQQVRSWLEEKKLQVWN
jgi:nesprin-1